MFSTDPPFAGPRATHTRDSGSRHWLSLSCTACGQGRVRRRTLIAWRVSVLGGRRSLDRREPGSKTLPGSVEDQQDRRLGRAPRLRPATPSAAARHHPSRRPPADFSGVRWFGLPRPIVISTYPAERRPATPRGTHGSRCSSSPIGTARACRSMATPRCCTCRRQPTALSTISAASPASIRTGRSIGRPCAFRTR